MPLHASVIIPTFEDWPGLQTCLDCLTAQTADPAGFEIIVANNNPAPGLPDGLRLPGNARVIHVARPGSYAARNAAIAHAQGDVLFFTDSDCLPDARWIEAGLAAIAPLGPLARVAGAVELFPKGAAWTLPELYDTVHHMRQADYADAGFCATANLVARRTTFDHVGLFDQDRFSLGDGAWGHRATTLGSPIRFCPETLVRHPARASMAELVKKHRRLEGGRHQREVKGDTARRSFMRLLRFVSGGDLRRTLDHPGLTDWQRLQVLSICFRLGVISFVETMRLRYLAGSPKRS